MRAVEHHHNTPAQVSIYLRQALELVDELERDGMIDGDLRGIVLVKAIDLIAAKQVMLQQSPFAPAVPIVGR